MKNILLSLTLSGVKNIDKDITVKFFKSRLTKNVSINNQNVKGIYGENGSGKTAIISAMSIFKSLCLDDKYLLDSRNQIILNELVNKKTNTIHLKTEFFSKINEKGYVFCYEIFVNRENLEYCISSESLRMRLPSSSVYKDIFVINNGDFVSIDCSEKEKGILIDKTKNLLIKSTFASMCVDLAEYIEGNDLEFYLCCLISFFLNIVVHLEKADEHQSYILNTYLKKTKRENNFFENALYQAFSKIMNTDFYLKEVEKTAYQDYLNMISGMTKFIQIFKSDLINIDVETKEDEETYHCNLKFVYQDYSIDSEFESTGIKKLIELYQIFYKLNKGAIVFIDELDANLHDVYLCRLLEYVSEYAKGQLCFTSHNIGPMEMLSKQKYGIDFITRNKEIVSWTRNGNYSAMKQYKAGMVKDIPFNIEAFDFLSVFGDPNK